MNTTRKNQSGVVSLFVVIFTTLVLTILVVSFLRLMVQEQKQATNQDLSQSAYDSAVSGVEDAKRVLRACEQGDADACNAINNPDATTKCKTVPNAGVVTDNADSTETVINSGSGDTTTMNQGYTCVIITKNSDEYMGNLGANKSQLIPLRATGPFNRITIEWMHRDTGGGGGYSGGGVTNIETPTASSIVSLPPVNSWNANAPALVRAQAVLPTGVSVQANDLDSAAATTSYLRPATILTDATPLTGTNVPLPAIRSATSPTGPVATTVKPITCSNTVYVDQGYACKAQLQMPSGEVPAGSRVAYLRLTALYRDTSYRITLSSSSTGDVKFDGVQPSVDSTGRAGNLYRRVISRINMSDFIMPDARIQITGNLCKDFYIPVNSNNEASVSTCNTKPS